MVAELGGPADLLERPDSPPCRRGGRRRPSSRRRRRRRPRSTCARSGSRSSTSAAAAPARTTVVDHSVGLTEVAALGERVEPGDRPLALVHARDEDSAAPRRGRGPRGLRARRSARLDCPTRCSRFSGRCRRRSSRRGSPSRRSFARARCADPPAGEASSARRKPYRGAQPSSRRARSLTYTRSIDGNIRQPRAA